MGVQRPGFWPVHLRATTTLGPWEKCFSFRVSRLPLGLEYEYLQAPSICPPMTRSSSQTSSNPICGAVLQRSSLVESGLSQDSCLALIPQVYYRGAPLQDPAVALVPYSFLFISGGSCVVQLAYPTKLPYSVKQLGGINYRKGPVAGTSTCYYCD